MDAFREMTNLVINRACREDWPSIQRIFAEGIADGDATFAPEAPASWRDWTRGKILPCCLTAKREERVVGWVALGKVSERAVYSGVAEVKIYVERQSRDQSIGSRLLQAVIKASEDAGIWTLEARIFPENLISLQLHKRQGFREVGIREKIGKMESGSRKGTWRDVVLLERRSNRIGI